MANYLFEFYRGDDYAFKGKITDEDQNPVDISGWVLKTSMKLNFQDPDEEATVKVDQGPLSGAEAEAGEFYLLLPHEQTKNLLPAPYFFDVQREFMGTVSTIIRGRVKVHGDVTWRTEDE